MTPWRKRTKPIIRRIAVLCLMQIYEFDDAKAVRTTWC
jgi:hypothetical protein